MFAPERLRRYSGLGRNSTGQAKSHSTPRICILLFAFPEKNVSHYASVPVRYIPWDRLHTKKPKIRIYLWKHAALRPDKTYHPNPWYPRPSYNSHTYTRRKGHGQGHRLDRAGKLVPLPTTVRTRIRIRSEDGDTKEATNAYCSHNLRVVVEPSHPTTSACSLLI